MEKDRKRKEMKRKMKGEKDREKKEKKGFNTLTQGPIREHQVH